MDEWQIWGNNRSTGGRVGGGEITSETGGKEMRREKEEGGAEQSFLDAPCFLGGDETRLLRMNGYWGRRRSHLWKHCWGHQ